MFPQSQKNEKLFQKQKTRQATSLAICAIFLTTQLSLVTPHAFANTTLAAKPSEIHTRFDSPHSYFNRVIIPNKLGSVVDQFTGDKENLRVIYIQDAHAIPQAQKSIYHLIDYFQKKYGVDSIALEGTKGKFDPVLFRSFPDKEKLKRVFEGYLESGELSGAVTASVLGSSQGNYFGIENWALYEEGVSHFLYALKAEKDAEEPLKQFHEKIKKLKKEFYSAKARTIDEKLTDWQENPKHLPKLLKYFSGMRTPAPTKYPTLRALFQSVRQDALKDENELNHDLKVLSDQIKTQLKSKEIRFEWNQMNQDFNTQRIGGGEFAVFLNDCLNHLKSNSESQLLHQKLSAQLKELIQTHEILTKMQSHVFFDEFNAYLQELQGRTLQSDSEKQIAEIDSNLQLLNKLAKLELTPAEWQQFIQKMNLLKNFEFGTIQSIRALALEIHQFMTGLSMSFARKFYETTVERDQAFFKNLLRSTDKGKTKTVLLITGGFHVPGLEEKFRRNHISYVVVSPHMEEIPSETHYKDFMQGRVSWRNYFKVKRGEINLQEAFGQATVDKLLEGQEIVSGPLTPAPAVLMKQWRDELLRTLFTRNQIAEAGHFTPFIDNKLSGAMDSNLFRSLKIEWLNNLDQFIQNLTKLHRQGQINEINVAKLLSQPANRTPYEIPNHVIPAWWINPELQKLPLRDLAGQTSQRSELRSNGVNLDQVIQAPSKKWFKRSGIITDPEMSKKLRAHFLANAVGVADRRLGRLRDGVAQIKNIDYETIAAETGIQVVNIKNYWRKGKWNTALGIHELPTIGWGPAGILGLLLLDGEPEGESSFKAIKRLLGLYDLDLNLAEFEAVFPRMTTFLISEIFEAPAGWPGTDWKTANRHFLKNALQISEMLGIRQKDIVDHVGVTQGTVSWWKNNQDATITWKNAAAFAQYITGNQDPVSAVTQILRTPEITPQQLATIFTGFEPKSRGKISQPSKPSTPVRVPAVRNGQTYRWPQFYLNGQAQLTALPQSLTQFVPPASWLENQSNLKNLWLDLGTQPNLRKNQLKQIFRNLNDKLYRTDAKLTPDERKILQGRFLENLFVQLREQYPAAEFLTQIAQTLTMSEYMIWWWANDGQSQRGVFTPATIRWEHAVRLARQVFKASGLEDWEVLARVFSDRNLTENQIARIWNHAATIEEAETPAPPAPRSQSRVTPRQSAQTVEWLSKYTDGTAAFKPLANKYQKNRLRREEKKAAQARFLENVFFKLHQQGMTINEIAAAVERHVWTVQWWAAGGQNRNGSWEAATIPADRALALARLVKPGPRGRPTDSRILGALLGNTGIGPDVLAAIFPQGAVNGTARAEVRERINPDDFIDKPKKNLDRLHANQHFLDNAFKVAEALGIRQSDIAREVEVKPSTVHWWKNYQNAGIRWSNAVKFSKFLLKEGNDLEAVSRLYGVPGLNREQLAEIFPALANGDEPEENQINIDDFIRKPARGLDRKQANRHFLANAFRVADALDIRTTDISQAVGVRSSTVSWWHHNENGTIRWENAVKFAKSLSKESDEIKAVAQIYGNSALTREQLAVIFPALANGSEPEEKQANIDGVINKPKTNFDRKQANRHFLANAFRVAEALDISQSEIARTVGVNSSTVSWWKLNEGATILWENAAKLAKFLLDEDDEVTAVSRLYGKQELNRNQLAEIFNGLTTETVAAPQNGVDANRLIKKLPRGLDRKDANQNFLDNAFNLIEALHLTQQDIAGAVGVSQGTVNWWKNNEDATIRWENAAKLAAFLLKETNEVTAIAKLLGQPKATQEQLVSIFRGSNGATTPPTINTYITAPGSWFHRTDITSDMAMRARRQFLRNAFSLARGLNISNADIGRKLDTTSVNYWEKGKNNTRTGSYEPPTIGWDYAKTFAKYILEEAGDSGSNPFLNVSKILGIPDLNRREIETIFPLAREEGRRGRSEVRADEKPPFLTDLENTQWDKVDVTAKHALLDHFFRVHNIEPSDVINQTDLFSKPFLNGHTLEPMLRFYEREAKKRGYPSAVQYLLYDAGFEFEGYEDFKRLENIEKIPLKEREEYQSLVKKIQMTKWLDLFANSQMALYFLLQKQFFSFEEEHLLMLMSNQFVDWEAKNNRDDYTLERLKNMENILGSFTAEGLPEILVSQIQQRIISDLLIKAAQDKKRGKTLIAMRAIQIGKEWFTERLQDKRLSEKVRPIYEALVKHYETLGQRNYQQYVNMKSPKGDIQYLDLTQLEGIHFSVEHPKILMGDEMGIGKSVQSLATAQYVKANEGKHQRVLILASATLLKTTWPDEIRKWIPNTAQYEDREGKDDNRDFIATIDSGKDRLVRLRQATRDPRVRFILVNPEGFTRDNSMDAIHEELKQWLNPTDSLNITSIKIGDEAHGFRTAETDKSKKYRALNADRILNLSGTLVVNDTNDLFPVLNDLEPETFPTKPNFDIRFTNNGLVGRVALYIEMMKRGLLLRRVKEDILKVKEDDLKKLPPLLPIDFIEMDLSPEQWDEYLLRQERFGDATKDPKKTLDFLNEMRNAAIDLDFHNDPYARKPSDRRDYQHDVPKRLEQAVDEIERILSATDQKNKIAIFSEFWQPLHRLREIMTKRLGEDKIVFMETVNPSERKTLVDSFNENEDKKLFFSSTGIGGEGINLTGANYVIVLNLPYTDARLQQAINRLHRPGQKRPVHPIVFYAPGTWEENMREIVEEKKTLFQEVVEGSLSDREASSRNIERIKVGAKQRNEMQKLLAKLQDIYLLAKEGDVEGVRAYWNNFAEEYSKNIERLAAFTIAQTLFLFLFTLIQNGEPVLEKGDEIAFVPDGPATDIRALHDMRKIMKKMTHTEDEEGHMKEGLSMKDLKFLRVDFAEKMIEEGNKVLQRLGIHSLVERWNLVEDVLPANASKLVIGSEIGQYADELNSHQVAQRNWMLSQLIRMTKVNGYLLLWVHNKEISENAIDFLEHYFPEVQVVDHGSYTVDNLPPSLRLKLENMTFVFLKKTKHIEHPLEYLQDLPGDGFEIRTRALPALTRAEKILRLITNPRITGTKSGRIVDYIERGGMLTHLPAKGVEDLEDNETWKTLKGLRSQLFPLLSTEKPTLSTISQIQELVNEIINIRPVGKFIRGVYGILNIAWNRNAAWQQFAQFGSVLNRLKTEIKAIKHRPIITKVSDGEGARKEKPSTPKGPSLPDEIKSVKEEILQDGDLLELFTKSGFQFKEVKAGMDFFSSDVRLDEVNKTFWVNSDFLNNKAQSNQQKTDLLNLKIYLHLDALFPDSRLEALFVGLDLLQKRGELLKEGNRDLNAAQLLNFESNIDLLEFVIQLRTLPLLNGDPSKFQTAEGKIVPRYQNFLEEHRKSTVPLSFEQPLNEGSIRKVRSFLGEELTNEGGEDAWIMDFQKRHADKFPTLLAKGDLYAEIATSTDETLSQISIVHLDDAGNRKTLATLKPDHGSSKEPWKLNLQEIENWKSVEFVDWQGLYSEDKNKQDYVIRKKIINGRVVNLDQIPRAGFILVREDGKEKGPLLIRLFQNSKLVVFELSTENELSTTYKLLPKNNKPVAILDISNGKKEVRLEIPDHTVIKFNKDANTITFERPPKLGPGSNYLVDARFEPLPQSNRRAELRRITEVAARLVSVDQPTITEVSQSTAQMVKQFGLLGFARRLRGTFSSLLSDRLLVSEAMAANNQAGTSQAYYYLDGLLKEQNLEKNQFDLLAQRIFEESLAQLAAAIRNKEVTRLAPIIFYNPEMKNQLVQFVEKIHDAVEGQPALEKDNFKFHIIFANKVEMMDFVLGLKTLTRPSVEHYSVDGSESSWKALSKVLNSRVIENPIFRNAFGVFFPNESWMQSDPSLPHPRVVRSDIPVKYSAALIPRLALYFAQTETSAISPVSLLRALPDFGQGLEFKPNTGIRILVTLLQIMAESRKQFAKSA